jgi:lipopolysaccharide transport system ATP-binding protein
MSSSSIIVSNINKTYQIYEKPSDRLKQFIIPKFQKIYSKHKKFYKEFIALDNITFNVKKNETLGIIGVNGSGKSTLLQLLAGTLTQTSGEFSTYGKVACILELGSGFNPEFTGKENIFLNAALHGLSNQQINNKLDSIVKFSELENFIDQPIKTYSTGMIMRLAFSIIANLDADILLIDEAFAVGDAKFVSKCMRFIRDFQEKGTIVLVSHDINVIQSLCSKAMWLHEGKLMDISNPKILCEKYLRFLLDSNDKPELIEKNDNDTKDFDALDIYTSDMVFKNNINKSRGWETGKAKINNVKLINLENNKSDLFHGGEKVELQIIAETFIDLEKPVLGFMFKDKLGQDLFGENTLEFTKQREIFVPKNTTVTGKFVFKLPMLPDGFYSVMISIANGDIANNIQHNYLHDAVIIQVHNSNVRWGLVGIKYESAEISINE